MAVIARYCILLTHFKLEVPLNTEWCLLAISQTLLFTREDIRRHENVATRTPIRHVAREPGLSDTFIHERISI